MRFPSGIGELENMTFQEVFDTKPKWIECVDKLWTPANTGLFQKFYKFVKNELADPERRKEHEDRCRVYAKTLDKSKIPRYLIKYVD